MAGRRKPGPKPKKKVTYQIDRSFFVPSPLSHTPPTIDSQSKEEPQHVDTEMEDVHHVSEEEVRLGKRRRVEEEEGDTHSPAKKGRVGRKKDQTQKSFLLPFQPYLDGIQEAILDSEHSELTNTPCECGSGGIRLYRCVDCSVADVLCDACIVERHVRHPLHVIEEHTGKFFRQTSLSNLGLKPTLMHDGKKCPYVPEGYRGVETLIVHTNGIHKLRVIYCDCPDKPPRAIQLVKSKLFPGTAEDPRSAFSFDLLKDFHLHTRVSKKSSYDYLRAVQRKTDIALCGKTSTPHNQFRRVTRIWRWLTMQRWSGQAHSMDSLDLDFRPPESVAVVCLACPIPGVNMPEGWEKESSHYKNTKFTNIDANFGLINLVKKNDPDDISLLNGRGYFVEDEPFRKYVEDHANDVEEKSTCSNFHAMQNHNHLKYDKQRSSGVVMGICRHGLIEPQGAVDTQVGERFILGDYVLQNIMRHFLNRFKKKARKGTRRMKHIVGYDIGCQFCKNFVRRITESFPDLARYAEFVKFLVGKMHLTGHVYDCQYGHSFNYAEGVGRTDGEEIERFWSEIIQAAGSTKQMNPGHRHDALDDLIGDWNWYKLCKLIFHILRKLNKARENMANSENEFSAHDGLCRKRFGETTVEEWEQADTEPFKNASGQWESVYRRKTELVPSRATILKELLACEGTYEGKRGLSRKENVVDAGISFESRQRKIKEKLKGKSEDDEEEIERLRYNLRKELRKWRTAQRAAMPTIVTLLDEADLILHNVEDEPLFLPSSFTAEQREDFDLQDLADIEMRLREGEASDAIVKLQTALRKVSELEGDKKKQVGSSNKNTRAKSALNKAHGVKRKLVTEYNAARKAMLSLGLQVDSKRFPQLRDQDTYRPGTIEPHEFNSGEKKTGWIWLFGVETRTTEEVTEWEKDDMKVGWFRYRAARSRWTEEVVILEEEMRRLTRGFLSFCDAWSTLAEKHLVMGRAGAAAYASKKSNMYEELARRALETSAKAAVEWDPKELESQRMQVITS